MTTATANAQTGKRVFFVAEDPHAHGDEHHHAPNTTTGLGFWIYLMTDCLIFAIMFAMVAVLGTNFAAGPSATDLFGPNLWLILVNTFMLLFSSITFGFAMLQSYKGNVKGTIVWLLITAVFGLAFLAIEIYEFQHLIHIGAVPQRSAFLSSFFLLVATHGLHVAFGLIWLVVLVFQVRKHGVNEANARRLMCLSMFWHFLDLIWICVFSFVYLIGVVG